MTNPLTDWLDPLNRILIRQAVRSKQKIVTLRDGRVFTIDYDNYRGEPGFWLAPNRNNDLGGTPNPNRFAPCGWFTIKRFMDREAVIGI
jgi:hypothetical protein